MTSKTNKNLRRKAPIGLIALLSLGLFVSCGDKKESASSSATDAPSTTSSVVTDTGSTSEKESDPTPIVTPTGSYESDYSSKEEAKKAGAALNLKIAEEGMVLLQNKSNALPLTADEKNVTVFGYASLNPAGGGSTSGDTSGGVVSLTADIYSSLSASGFTVNPTVKSAYETAISTSKAASDYALAHKPTIEEKEVPNGYGGTTKQNVVTAYSQTEKALDLTSLETSYTSYDDAAIIVLGTPNTDLINPADTLGIPEAHKLNHKLQLDNAQLELVSYAKTKFNKVIVLINSSKPLELGSLANSADSILIVGEPGDNGFNALGEILNGNVNPSGRTTDTWASDFTKDPSYVNFNTTSNSSGSGSDGQGTTTGYGRYSVNDSQVNTWYTDYEEGIYVGYRYYETRSYEEDKVANATKDAWFTSNVNYPFGYGLSYTTFDWTITPKKESGALSKEDTLEFDVKVKNTGTVAGKDVVELYYSAPYTAGGIEKSYVNLGDYAKTKLLQPNEEETLTLKIDVRDMASYDYKTNKTYVLEDGTYDIKFMHSSHTFDDANNANISYTVASDILFNTSESGYTVANQFDDVTTEFEKHADKILSRANFASTMPTKASDITLTSDEYDEFGYDNANDQDATLTANDVKYATSTENRGSKAPIQLEDLKDLDANDKKWDEFVQQLTLEELQDLVNGGGFHSVANDYIGKPYSFDTDGPKGWTGSGTDTNDAFNSFAAEPMIAATFNKQLAYDMGELIGDQGLWGNSTIKSGKVYSYTGWYAPGMNIHRSPFDTRYTEYYSEDPVLTGNTAANASLGAKSKGAYICIKHFAFHNDGGGVTTYRMGAMMAGSDKDGLSAYMSEQTAREIYLKGYQIAVEDGKATFAMASFTRIGKTWCGGSKALNTEILRNEWGFKGAIVTDICIYKACNAYQFINAGGDMMLANYSGTFIDVSKTELNTPTNIKAMQNAAKHICYMVLNSNAMQMPKGAKIVYDKKTVENEDGDQVEETVPTGKVGQAYTYNVGNAEFNTYGNYGHSITYSMTGAPDGLTINSETGVISGTPTTAGTYSVKVTASSPDYGEASQTYTIVIEA